MSMVAHSTGPASADGAAIQNNGFWPDIDPAAARAAERLRSEITPDRLYAALQAAMIDINRQLADWAQAQVDAGVDSHEDIEPLPWHIQGQTSVLYRRAVYASAHADLIDRYYDYSATNDSADKLDADNDAADDYRRTARWAVAEIMGRNHATVELI